MCDTINIHYYIIYYIVAIMKIALNNSTIIVFTCILFILQFGQLLASEQQTDSYDSQSMKYLYYILIPLVIGDTIYSLMYLSYYKRFVSILCLYIANLSCIYSSQYSPSIFPSTSSLFLSLRFDVVGGGARIIQFSL